MTSDLSQRLQLLFNAPVSVCVASSEMYNASLFPEEQRITEGAIEKRRKEFAAGRAAARQALENLGISPGPILMNPDRSPRWPARIKGSISHCDGLCVAVVADNMSTASIGIDVEPDTPLQRDLLYMVCGEDELAESVVATAIPEKNAGKIAFCAKEAFYKCHFPLRKTFLDFLDISVHLSAPDAEGFGGFSIREKGIRDLLSNKYELTGRWTSWRHFVFAGATLIYRPTI